MCTLEDMYILLNLEIYLPFIHQGICKNYISIEKGCNLLGVTKYILYGLFRLYNLPKPSLRKGRKPEKINKRDVDAVLNYRASFKVGYKRCCTALRRHGYYITFSKVYKIYFDEKIFLEKKYKKQNKHNKRYSAKYKNQMWSTDLHEISIKLEDDTTQKVYIIAFIDDATRFMVYIDIMFNKTMENTSKSLIKALQSSPYIPHTIHSDNGTEFTGIDFQTVLNENNIHWTHTLPYTPQQNGKIERWWKTLETSGADPSTLAAVIHEYNNYWEHSALRTRFGKDMTPAEAYQILDNWSDHDDLEFIYFE